MRKFENKREKLGITFTKAKEITAADLLPPRSFTIKLCERCLPSVMTHLATYTDAKSTDIKYKLLEKEEDRKQKRSQCSIKKF